MRLIVKLLFDVEVVALARIAVVILLCRRSAQKIVTDSRNSFYKESITELNLAVISSMEPMPSTA